MTPVFVFDVLQLPGTLAGILRLDSSLQLVKQMTRARLVGPEDVVMRLEYAKGFDMGALKGMVVFGVPDREDVHEFYGRRFETTSVQIEVRLLDGGLRHMEAVAWITKSDPEPVDVEW